MKRSSFLIFPLLLFGALQAQNPFPGPGEVFRDDLLPKVKIWLPADSLEKMYQDPLSDHETAALFVFESDGFTDTVPNIGFRFRGNTSRYSAKKSFKVSFNTFIKGRSFQGLEKMNLNGEHNDPSIIRSKLSWDLHRLAGVPAPRSNHILLYINDIFKGIYINVEHIDEEFAGLRFGSKKGNLYKCLYPADLVFISKNPDDYKFMAGDRRAYELTTNESKDDYTDLSEFIDILNNTPIDQLAARLDPVLNVSSLLRMMVVDVFTGNWDGPLYNKNNFYLYQNPLTGRFEIIPYDLDNTFGIDWFNIDWASRDVYEWSPVNEPRPLYTRILQVHAFKAEYTRLFYDFLDRISEDDYLVMRAVELRALYSPLVGLDPLYRADYGWTYSDFSKSFSQRLGAGHVKYGLFPYIFARSESARRQLDPLSGLDGNTVDFGLDVYPVPAGRELFINNNYRTGYFRLFNINGILTRSGTMDHSYRTAINVSDIPSGFYLIVLYPQPSLLTPDDSQPKTIKIIITH